MTATFRYASYIGLSFIISHRCWFMSSVDLSEVLSLSNNKLSGAPRDAFDRLVKLESISLDGNLFNGTIPHSIFKIPNITLVYLSNNMFNGTIPSNYADAENLRDLYLDGNIITGTIPSNKAGQLTMLNELLLEKNYLNGTMPASICDLFNGTLQDLFADCGTNSTAAQVECSCCTQCF
jgi:Leucine rich repeat